ncbi:pickpocket protein 28-like [Periplaneta americana]|uniref:pickpocket protein 28-like n=1 Tax=Periplaneta americana TaxID=6978 RepID=UPI0037E98093
MMGSNPGPRTNRSEQMIRRIEVLRDRHLLIGPVHENPAAYLSSPIMGMASAFSTAPTLPNLKIGPSHVDSSHSENSTPAKEQRKNTSPSIAKKYATLYLNESSIHGFNHLAAPKRTCGEHAVWLVFVILAISGAVWLSLSIKQHYDESPTAISIEVNNMDWYTLFPAGTLCLDDKVDEILLDRYITENLKNVKDKEGVKEFIRSLANATYDNFKYIKDIPNNPIKSEDYLKVLLEVRQLLIFGAVNTEQKIVPLVSTVTERGLCYTYNNMAAFYNDPEYWLADNWTLIEGSKTLEVHPVMKSVTASFFVRNNTGLTFYYHNPLDVVDLSDFGHPVYVKGMLRILLQALGTITTPEARELSVAQRKCRFPEENFLKISPVYTFNLCKAQCRMRLAQKKCGCIPYFYRRVGHAKVCDVEGMHCLGKHPELYVKFLYSSTGRRHKCKCISMCNDVTYNIDSKEVQPNPTKEGTSAQWGIEHYPKMRVKRDVIFGFTDLWVSVGGTGGLFLGCSVLSIIEIFYFLTLRLYVYLYRTHADKKRAQYPLGRQNDFPRRVQM